MGGVFALDPSRVKVPNFLETATRIFLWNVIRSSNQSSYFATAGCDYTLLARGSSSAIPRSSSAGSPPDAGGTSPVPPV